MFEFSTKDMAIELWLDTSKYKVCDITLAINSFWIVFINILIYFLDFMFLNSFLYAHGIMYLDL